MLNRSEKGFTLIELIVTITILAILATMAVSYYQTYIRKAQMEEAIRLMYSKSIEIESMKKFKTCTIGGNSTTQGKYGTLVVSGTYTAAADSHCPIGCIATYTVGGTNISSDLKGKTVVANFLNNGEMAKVINSTTLSENYLPSNFNNVASYSEENCAALTTTPTQTNGSGINGTETGRAS